MAGKPIDLDRCRRGMKQLSVVGHPRPALIEEAIAAIQKAPVVALQSEYFGIKNYAGFGDQREDHPYGYGPKHGGIVFSIGRTETSRKADWPLDRDAVYLLEAYRDFGRVNVVDRHANGSYGRDHLLDLCSVIRRLDLLAADAKVLTDAIAKASVETHVTEAAHV